ARETCLSHAWQRHVCRRGPNSAGRMGCHPPREYAEKCVPSHVSVRLPSRMRVITALSGDTQPAGYPLGTALWVRHRRHGHSASSCGHAAQTSLPVCRNQSAVRCSTHTTQGDVAHVRSGGTSEGKGKSWHGMFCAEEVSAHFLTLRVAGGGKGRVIFLYS